MVLVNFECNGRIIRRWSLSLESVRKTIIDTYLLERTRKDHGKLQVRISEPSRCVICAVEAKKDESFAQDGNELIGQMKALHKRDKNLSKPITNSSIIASLYLNDEENNKDCKDSQLFKLVMKMTIDFKF
ncbi:unnamed protein product [Rhizophagus irregularis]|nr:unnamed protein product [Rhizophagus irregularis]